MVGTRRTSKLPGAVEEEESGSSPQQQQRQQPSLTVPIPEDFDLEGLTSLVPDLDLHSPSPDALVNLYRLLLEQSGIIESSQREVEELRAEAEKKDVELDQALQDREQSSKDMEYQVEQAQEELNQVKQERDHLVAANAELQARVTTLSTSQSSSSNEVEELKRRLEDVEREKRDLVSVISRLKLDSAEREDEVSALRSDLKAARQEHQAFEGQVREIRATETSTKFKLESLSQQLQLAQSEVERVNMELSTKSEEYGNYRRTKQAEFVTLQAKLSDVSQNYSSSQATLKALQSSHASQTHQLTQALTKVQDLTGQLAEQEAIYSTEAKSLRRLVEMLEDREKQTKVILDGIEQQFNEEAEKMEVREAVLKAETEKAKKGREAAENRIEQLEKVLNKMERGELAIPGRGSAVMSTPSRRTSVAVDDGIMGLSPTIAMASKVQKSGKSFTEVYTAYVQLQDDYDKKCVEYARMEEALASTIAQVEERAPVINDQREEYYRTKAEASLLSSQLSQVIAERDIQANAAKDNAQKLVLTSRENQLLQQQLEDTGRQLRNMLREAKRHEDINFPSDEELESVLPEDNVQNVITNQLVLYRSIDQLQELNQTILRTIRETSQNMEDQEKVIRAVVEKENEEALREAYVIIQGLNEDLETQKKHSDGIIQAYVQERDTLKVMLSRSSNQSGGVVNGSGELDISNPSTPSSSALAKELSDVQTQFDAYRTEMGVDSVRLREENIAAQREIGQLQANLAKLNAKSENQTERHHMLQDQLSLQNQELNDLTKRNQQLFDQWTRVDVECGRVSEDLRVANARLEQLRNECANLRAEKGIWESIQTRLVEENKSLAMERSHLSDLMTNVQKMHNDLERTGENDRRRLENQLQLLENQSQELRNQLTQERDIVRNLSLQKEVEVRELQNRLDRSIQELSKTREALAVAETSKVHLEDRVSDLTKHMKGNEEKLAVYERRGGAQNSTVDHSNMNREQQFEAEVAELRSALKVAEFDLSQAKSHVQQFQSISEANETALHEFQSTHEDYKASTDAQIARLESDRQALEERLQAIQTELSELNTKHTELQKRYEDERVAWTNDKKTLEDTIVDLSTSEKVSENDRTSRESEVKQQEERAKAAEERYSNELLSHAESRKTLENLRKQLASVQATVRDYQTAAETASAKLVSSESSWQQQKQALDNEVKELHKRSNDLVEQNNLLHKHLESVSSQATRIRQATESTASTGIAESDANDHADTKLSELRSVVGYLRKEKEIVDLQLELSKQEATRMKSQIDHLQVTLNETRRTLTEEREKAVESAASSAQHEELIERINQLNILRESNATLRADCEAHAKRAKELETKLQLLGKQLEPAKEEARTANAELLARDTQIKRLEEENRRWQGRNQQLLTKYDRIDPSEMQTLKDEIDHLKAEKTTFEQTIKEREDEVIQHKTRVKAIENNLANYKDSFAKNMSTYKANLGELNAARSKLTSEKKELEDKIAALEGKTRELQATNTSLQADKAALESSSSSNSQSDAASAELASLRAERDQLLAEKATWTASAPPPTSNISDAPLAWETERTVLIAARDQLQTELKEMTTKAESSSNTAKSNKAAFERLNQRYQALTKAREEDAQKAVAAQEAAVSAAIEKVKIELATPNSQASADGSAKEHQEELKALEERLTAKHQAELKSALESSTSGTTSSSNVDVDAAVAAAIAAHDKEREAKLAEEILAAVESGRMEAASKMKIKDSQVIRAQTKLKEYEAQIQAWKAQGIIPQEFKIAPLPNKAPPPPSPSISSSPSIASTVPTATPVNAVLPRKPSVPAIGNPSPNAAASASAPVATSAGRGRGGPAIARVGAGVTRGAVRGVVRGAAAGAGAGAGRGAPLKQQPPLSGGITIQGAAKRPAPDSTGDDSLAKRLKPAPGGPVPLRRPPPS